MTVLVVSANGQLGERCCRVLAARGHPVRGSVRRRGRGRALEEAGIPLVEADLTSPGGFNAALAGVETLVVTANAVVPRRGDDPATVDRGLHGLVDDAEAAGVRRLVLVSITSTDLADKVPVLRERRELERHVLDADLEGVVLRFPPFMEAWLALVGSSLPLRGEPCATIGRPSPFLQLFRKGTGRLVEARGIMLVPGSARLRNAFIALDDVAAAVAETVERTQLPARVLEVGGPEVLSWADVAAAYSEILHRKVRIVSTPAAVYAAMSKALAPVHQVAARIMGINWLLATTETPWAAGGRLLDPAAMTTVRQFLERKAALPAELPTVP